MLIEKLSIFNNIKYFTVNNKKIKKFISVGTVIQLTKLQLLDLSMEFN